MKHEGGLTAGHVDSSGPDDTLSVIAYILTGGAAPLTLWFGPVLLGSYIEILGLAERQAVLLLSGEFAGYAIAGAIGFVLLPIMSWRRIVLGAFCVIVAGNLASVAVTSFVPLLVFRFLTGVGAGTLMMMSMVAIGLTRSPERIYGLWTAIQILAPAGILLYLPGLIAAHGLAAPFLIVASLAAALLWVYRFYPVGGQQKADGSLPVGASPVFVLGALGLAGVFVFFGGQSTVWAFGERMGMHRDFPADAIGEALSIGALGGLAGALLAFFLGSQHGRILPLVAAMLVSMVGVLVLEGAQERTLFTLGLCLVCGAWNFSAPYLQTIIANLDRSGRMVALLAIVLPASMSAGPALASLFLSEGGGYMPVVWMLMISLPLGLLLIRPAASART